MKTNCMLLGDCKVGKTHLLSHCKNKKYKKYIYLHTIGIDFQSYKHLHIWDTSGLPKYHGIMPSFLNSTDIAVICFNNKESFNSIPTYVSYIQKYGKKSCSIHILSLTNNLNVEMEGWIYCNAKNYKFHICDVNNKEQCLSFLTKLKKEKSILPKNEKNRFCWWNLW